ncbi:MAG: response regulator transcription factor [Ferruginibacter sp.]
MIKVLVYDDSQARRESLAALLQLMDTMECVGSFGDCSNVLEEMETHQPDVVLMDIEMPNVNGIEGVRIIKKKYPQIKIIMQTAFEDNDKIFAALQYGAEGYILKKASIQSITQSIDEVYKGGAFMTPSVAMKVMNYFNQNNKDSIPDYKLTIKEKEVLQHLSDGLSYKMAADKMGISYYTVNTHVKNVYEKLHVHSLGEAVSMAIKNKLV